MKSSKTQHGKVASWVLQDKSTSKSEKSAAGSALSSSKARNVSITVTQAASKTLSNGNASKSAKSLAGSALTQTQKNNWFKKTKL